MSLVENRVGVKAIDDILLCKYLMKVVVGSCVEWLYRNWPGNISCCPKTRLAGEQFRSSLIWERRESITKGRFSIHEVWFIVLELIRAAFN